MARIAGVNIPDNKHAKIALTIFLELDEPKLRRYVLRLGSTQFQD